MVNKCGKCGSENPLDAVYCKKCGNQLQNQKNKMETIPTKRKMFSKNDIVLSSPNAFEDGVSGWKALGWLSVVVGIIIIFVAQSDSPDVMRKLFVGLLLGFFFMFLIRVLVVNGIASVKVTQLNFRKYWLPYPISDEELAKKISGKLLGMQMRAVVNTGLTKGLEIICEDLSYKIDLENRKGYFKVSFHYNVYSSTYLCIIRDMPKIIYTIQQAMLADV